MISNKFTIQSVREQSRNSVGSIMVLRDGGPVTFEEESMLFRSIDEAFGGQIVVRLGYKKS